MQRVNCYALKYPHFNAVLDPYNLLSVLTVYHHRVNSVPYFLQHPFHLSFYEWSHSNSHRSRHFRTKQPLITLQRIADEMRLLLNCLLTAPIYTYYNYIYSYSLALRKVYTLTMTTNGTNFRLFEEYI